MAKGSVIAYRGTRGTVWRIKYVDAAGKQVMETIGAEHKGVTRKQAEEQLERRRVEVRDGLRAPEALSFAQAGRRWFDSDAAARSWKPGTVAQYRHWLADVCDYFARPVASIGLRQINDYRDWALSRVELLEPGQRQQPPDRAADGARLGLRQRLPGERAAHPLRQGAPAEGRALEARAGAGATALVRGPRPRAPPS